MLEHPDIRSTDPDTKTNRRMIKLIGNNQAALSNKGGDERGIGGETHRTDKGILHASKFSHEGFGDDMEIARTASEPRSACTDAVSSDRLFYSISTSTAGLCKAEVIIGRDIKSACAIASEDLGVVVVGGDTVEKNNGTPCHSRNGLRETLVQTSFEPAGIERIKI